ncbi:MAG TPA: HupE/UreJ family protein, partial [Desulfosarcina sp.]|nr:HupE/UreJ family protein [Desulfosarcina sp.]
AGRRALFLLPAAWLAGGIAGLTAGAVPSLPVQAASLLVVGSIVAADLYMPANAVSMLSIVVGLSHGFFNGAVLQEGPGVSGLIGIAIMLFVLLALTSAFVVTRKQPWTRIAVRVAGSWIVATGLLMVGWVIRGTS